jgi:hypothetical protein
MPETFKDQLRYFFLEPSKPQVQISILLVSSQPTSSFTSISTETFTTVVSCEVQLMPRISRSLEYFESLISFILFHILSVLSFQVLATSAANMLFLPYVADFQMKMVRL